MPSNINEKELRPLKEYVNNNIDELKKEINDFWENHGIKERPPLDPITKKLLEQINNEIENLKNNEQSK